MDIPTEFKIRTLQDIFNLPTEEQMDRCLQELCNGMTQLRVANDAIQKAMVEFGGGDKPYLEWPETILWKDDDKEVGHLRIDGIVGIPPFQIDVSADKPTLNVYTNNQFSGHYPVGTAAVVVAQNAEMAADILNIQLEDYGLPADAKEKDMNLVDLYGGNSVILCDGNY